MDLSSSSCIYSGFSCQFLINTKTKQTVKGLQSKGLMRLPIFLVWPHLIFRDFPSTMCMHYLYIERDTCAALDVPAKGFSVANLILSPWRMKSLVGGHSSWKLEKKDWSCNGKLASERLQESQACPPHFLRGPEIPNAASRKTHSSLG